MYDWRSWTPALRKEALDLRKKRHVPWHSPPHEQGDNTQFLVTAACYEHKPVIGHSLARMASFESELLAVLDALAEDVFAWVVLPNHYHALVQTDAVQRLIGGLGKLHGRTSHDWNSEDGRRGRQVWHNAHERGMKSESHSWTTLNYVHHNPVKHGFVDCWQDWPFSSAGIYLAKVGREQATRIWREYPLFEYGKKWDSGMFGVPPLGGPFSPRARPR